MLGLYTVVKALYASFSSVAVNKHHCLGNLPNQLKSRKCLGGPGPGRQGSPGESEKENRESPGESQQTIHEQPIRKVGMQPVG
jgi:hypothetical protein